MYQTIVRDDVRDREHPVMTRLGERVDAGAGQGSLRRDQRVVYPVHPLDHPAGAGQVELGHRGTRQDAGLRTGRHELAYRRCVQLHVGVEVDPGERAAGLVAQSQPVRLAGHRRLDDPHALHLPRRLSGAIGTGVRHDDDIELAGGTAVEQPAQVSRDDRFFVVRRYDDADRGLAHAGQDNRDDGEISTTDRTEKDRMGACRP
jgi:hypothetical protein